MYKNKDQKLQKSGNKNYKNQERKQKSGKQNYKNPGTKVTKIRNKKI
jgi:hypothetical protein